MDHCRTIIVFWLVHFLLVFETPAQNVAITLPSYSYEIDHTKHLIVAIHQGQLPSTVGASSISVQLDEDYTFAQVPSVLETGTGYAVLKENEQYQLFFSPLPLLVVNSELTIVDEPPVLGEIRYVSQTEDPFLSVMGIEIRGAWSQTYPKKSYRFELFQDASGVNTQDHAFAGMRSDDDWILTAMYNEPLRLRNVTAQKLWLDIHQLAYAEEEESAQATIKTAYTDVFINGEYKGVYMLSERVDRKLLELKSFNGTQRGELFKGKDWGATQYTSCPPYSNSSRLWEGFEYEYPKEDEITDWENLYNAVDLVVNGSDIDLETQLSQKFELKNLVDYFLFVNLIRAADNLGKNVFVARYDQDRPYFYVPWDLDGILGNGYDGNQEPWTTEIYSNGLYNRLMNNNVENFLSRCSNRWFQLRENGFSESALLAAVNENVSLLQTSGAYEREGIAWNEFAYDENILSYLENWLHDRLIYLDEYFSEFVDVNEIEQLTTKVYPNPTSSFLSVFSEDVIDQIHITDPTGRLVLTIQVNGNQARIDVSGIPTGMYHIHFETEERRQVSSFFKTN